MLSNFPKITKWLSGIQAQVDSNPEADAFKTYNVLLQSPLIAFNFNII